MLLRSQSERESLKGWRRRNQLVPERILLPAIIYNFSTVSSLQIKLLLAA